MVRGALCRHLFIGCTVHVRGTWNCSLPLQAKQRAERERQRVEAELAALEAEKVALRQAEITMHRL
jgi:hypothetical protein